MPEGTRDESEAKTLLKPPKPATPVQLTLEKVPLYLVQEDERIQLRAKMRKAPLAELTESVRRIGILHPILVERKGPRFRILAGNRRFAAARGAGMPAVPAFVVEGVSDKDAIKLALTENLLRENLSPYEVAVGCLLLKREHACDYAEITELTGLQPKSIQRRMRIAIRATPAVAEALHEGRIGNAHALAILRLPSEQQDSFLQKEVLATGLGKAETESRVKDILRTGRNEQRSELVKEVGSLPPYARVEKTNRAGEHELAISYHSPEELLARLRDVEDRLRERSRLPLKRIKPAAARPQTRKRRSILRRRSR